MFTNRGAHLHGDVQSHSSFGEGHRRAGYSQSMQLIAGRTAQEYNQRKGRQGAFWEDRYHATAIKVDEHLHRCLVYIDLNMVRAGVVKHLAEWATQQLSRNSGAAQARYRSARDAIILARIVQY
jgi:hypothetical protein